MLSKTDFPSDYSSSAHFYALRAKMMRVHSCVHFIKNKNKSDGFDVISIQDFSFSFSIVC